MEVIGIINIISILLCNWERGSHDKIVTKIATNTWIQSRKGYFLMVPTVVCFKKSKGRKNSKGTLHLPGLR